MKVSITFFFSSVAVAALSAALLWAPAASAQAELAPTDGTKLSLQATQDQIKTRCGALARVDFSRLLDAPSQIQKAEIAQLANVPLDVCRVDGYVFSSIGFVLLMPQNWNGKYVQGGCGGACGLSNPIWCYDPITHGYACLGSDMGHRSTTADWQWARENLGLKADFGFRSTHAASVAGKAITAAYYGQRPGQAYFMGCSTGGRQAFMQAQRFPADFDGIVGNAPPLNETGTALQLAWTVLANLDKDGNYIIREQQARLLHEAVVKTCDMNDGIRDGLIGDPRRCGFKPESLLCKAGQAGDCLTEEQVRAAQKMYGGMVDSKGSPIGVQRAVMPGSELNWIGDYLPRGERAPQYLPFLTSFFVNTGFDTPVAPGWKLSDVDFERDWTRLGSNEVLYNAQNPDLREFKKRGGKLLSVQGWGDTSVVPTGTIDYYDGVTRMMGGPDQTRDFFRLFMVPGMRHCSADSVGADAIDFLTAIDTWVTKGQAPDFLMGHNYDWRGPPTSSTPLFPLAPERVRLTRIIYAYPDDTRYVGQGDPNDPRSWKKVPTIP